MNAQPFKKPHLPSIRLFFLAAICGCFLSLNGCSKEEMKDMVAKAKDSATELKDKSGDALKKAKDSASDAASDLKGKAAELKETVTEKAGNLKESASNLTQRAGNMLSMNGTAFISLGRKTEFPGCYVRVVNMDSGKSVLQLKSYPEDGETKIFPAYFLQGTTDATSSTLNGKTVACRFFAQLKQDGPVWENVPGELIQVKFSKTEDQLTAKFSGANVLNIEDGTTKQSNGSFECADLK